MKQEVGKEKDLKVEYLLVDLASFSSVKNFVRTFREKNLPLHILINNAGIAWVPFSKSTACIYNWRLISCYCHGAVQQALDFTR